MTRKRILIFPCGSEIGLEIHRSLKHSRHVNLIGGSSVEDHGVFVFENYHGNFPLVGDDIFPKFLQDFVKENHIDAIYPAMDNVIAVIKPLENLLGCRVICSSEETALICSSKKETYRVLKRIIKTPKEYYSIKNVTSYPIFIKPDRSYGAMGAKRIDDENAGIEHLKTIENAVITEYMEGAEYTVDCFTNKNRELLFAGPRPRRRIKSGISVNTISIPPEDRDEFRNIAAKINKHLHFQGAWFFQVKEDGNSNLVLLEVASRMGGSSMLYRYKGINFALLSIFDAFGLDVEISENIQQVEIDRAFGVDVKIDFDFDQVYVDFDDCLIIDNKVNTGLVAKLFEFFNEGKKIHLITRHKKDIVSSLKFFRLYFLFDTITHITDENDSKSNYILGDKSIFIDDSYAERKEVFALHRIPVFSPDMISDCKF